MLELKYYSYCQDGVLYPIFPIAWGHSEMIPPLTSPSNFIPSYLGEKSLKKIQHHKIFLFSFIFNDISFWKIHYTLSSSDSRSICLSKLYHTNRVSCRTFFNSYLCKQKKDNNLDPLRQIIDPLRLHAFLKLP